MFLDNMHVYEDGSNYPKIWTFSNEWVTVSDLFYAKCALFQQYHGESTSNILREDMMSALY